MSEVKHTPWRVIDEDHDLTVDGEGWFNDQYPKGWVVVGNPDDPRFAVLVVETGDKDNVWDDEFLDGTVARITTAVNSHGDLVEALRVARKRLNGIFECSEDRYSATAAETAIAEIDTALSKVLELGEGL